MGNALPFEHALIELRRKIDELHAFSKQNHLNFQAEIAILEERYNKFKEEIYKGLTAEQKMQIARHPQRPTTEDYIQHMFTHFFELHGDRLFGDDGAVVGGIAKLNGVPVTVIGHQKGRNTKENLRRNFGMPHPEGFRKALRLMQQANRFNRPIITFIDTSGAYPGQTAEERGQSEAIARNLYEMSRLTVPVISVVIGEGGSGGALALGLANRILMLEHAIYSVASPNAAAAILWKDAAKAGQAAEAMKITADDLQRLGIIDGIIPELSPINLESQAVFIKQALLSHLRELRHRSGEQLREDRMMKYRSMGAFTFDIDSSANKQVEESELVSAQLVQF